MKAVLAGIGVASALVVTMIPAMPAHADVQAQASDIVGVGSDTVQYLSDFIADGDANGHAGYNKTHLSARIANYEATGDAFGSLSTGFGVVERAGQKPAIRPDGSGTGYDALNADTNNTIQYVRASSTPNSTRLGLANTNFGGYHAYRVTTDDVRIAVAGSAAPAASEVPTDLTAAELNTLYTANPGTPGNLATCPTFAAAIGRGPNSIAKPLIPQSGSGTRNSFLPAIGLATTATLGACVTQVQEHDPRPVAASIDAFGPFSFGRLSLINAGYFSAAGIPANDVALQSVGLPAARSLYIVLRQNDLANTATTSAPSAAVNNATVISDFFAPGTGAYTKNAATALYSSAGFVPSVQDCEATGASGTPGPNNFC